MSTADNRSEKRVLWVAALAIFAMFTVFRWQAITFNDEIMVES